MSQAIRVLVADDHPVVLAGLVAMLGRRPGLAVVGEAADGAQAVDMTARLNPDVVLMDLRMPALDGVEATRRIRRDCPGSRVLILTTFDQDDLILSGLRAGARGYILKDASPDDIVRAIETVHSGEVVLAPAVAARVVEHVAPASQGVQGQQGLVTSPLTERERDVLAWLAAGLSNRQIGEKLSIAESTVKTHLAGLYGKLAVTDRTGAVTEAVRRGWLRLH